MAQEGPNRFSEWLLVAREQVPHLRRRLGDWFEAVREEPVLLWETPVIRYGTYLVSGAVLTWTLVWAVGLVTPAPPAAARPQATTADFHVLCTAPECGTRFVIHRKFGFNRFPVECPACRRESGYAARPCHSATCGHRWVVPVKSEGVAVCPYCGGRFD